MKNASISRQSAEAMAAQAHQQATTVADLYANAYHVTFLTRGHTASESIERSVNVTPELIKRAEAILAEWCA